MLKWKEDLKPYKNKLNKKKYKAKCLYMCTDTCIYSKPEQKKNPIQNFVDC